MATDLLSKWMAIFKEGQAGTYAHTCNVTYTCSNVGNVHCMREVTFLYNNTLLGFLYTNCSVLGGTCIYMYQRVSRYGADLLEL